MWVCPCPGAGEATWGTGQQSAPALPRERADGLAGRVTGKARAGRDLRASVLRPRAEEQRWGVVLGGLSQPCGGQHMPAQTPEEPGQCSPCSVAVVIIVHLVEWPGFSAGQRACAAGPDSGQSPSRSDSRPFPHVV